LVSIFLTISILCVFSLLLNKKKREIPFGKLVSHKKWHLEGNYYISEVVTFKDSVQCIKYYNKLIFQFSKKVKSYDIDGWTTNKLENSKGHIKLYRYGNNIKLVRKTIK